MSLTEYSKIRFRSKKPLRLNEPSNSDKFITIKATRSCSVATGKLELTTLSSKKNLQSES